jgi:hypothetical protein
MKSIATLFLLTASTFGQNYVQKVVELKYIDPDTVLRLMFMNSPTKDGYAAQLRANKELGVVTIYGLPDDVDRIAVNIATLDKARPGSTFNRNLDMRVYMLVASKTTAAGDELPKDIEPVAGELRAGLGYKEVKLLDAAIFRMRQNERSEARGSLPCQASETEIKGKACQYQLVVRAGSVRGPKSTLNIEGLQFNATFATSLFDRTVSINTAFDVADGQKVVIGKSNIDGADRSLVLVVTARAVD